MRAKTIAAVLASAAIVVLRLPSGLPWGGFSRQLAPGDPTVR